MSQLHDQYAIAQWLDSAGSARAVMDLAHDAVVLRDPASRVEYWSVGALRLYGWTPKEALGKVTHALLDTKFPSSKDAVDEALFGKGYWEGQLQHRCKDGRRIVVESRQALLRGARGKPLLIKEINRDVTQQHRQLSYLRLLNEVSVCVNEARTIEEALRQSLVSICLHGKWCAARACTVRREDSGETENTSVWFLSDEKRLAAFRDATNAGATLPRQKRVAERVFEKGEPVWIRDIYKDPAFVGILQAKEAELVCAYGFPVLLGPKVAIVITLFSDAAMELDEAFVDAMSGVGRHLNSLFERFSAEAAQRALSVSLLRAQDDERRRIARELHDSTGQYLCALSLAIDAAQTHAETMPAAATRKLEEASEIISRCSAELRTLSHLLHPPLLEELGLVSAVNWYVEGFAERSGLKVDLQLPARLARFDSSVELTLFRSLQECLTNIHRHSGSKTASVRIESGDRHVILEVRDQGKGIEPEVLGKWFGERKRVGVGITGLRERMKDLGGTLEIDSNRTGTTIRATIPIRQQPSATAPGEGFEDTRKAPAVVVGTSD